jgi:hypothetical protein
VKIVGYLLSALLFALGVVLGLYGLLALTFKEGNGSMHVKIAAHQLDANLAGLLSLSLAAAVIALGVVVARRQHRS